MKIIVLVLLLTFFSCELVAERRQDSISDEQVEEVTHTVTDRHVLRGSASQMKSQVNFAGKVTAETAGELLNWWTGGIGGTVALGAAGVGASKWQKRRKKLQDAVRAGGSVASAAGAMMSTCERTSSASSSSPSSALPPSSPSAPAAP